MVLNQFTNSLYNIGSKITYSHFLTVGATALMGGLAAYNTISGSNIGYLEIAAAIGMGYETKHLFSGTKSGGKGHLLAAIGLGLSIQLNIADGNIAISTMESYIGMSFFMGKVLGTDFAAAKFHLLGKMDAVEDMFIKKSDEVLSTVSIDGTSDAIYEAMVYTENEVIGDSVKNYLKKEIIKIQKSYLLSARAENQFRRSSEEYRNYGKLDKANISDEKADFEKRMGDKAIFDIQNANFLIDELDEGGLEGYVRGLSHLYPDWNSYLPNEFNKSLTEF